MTTETMSLTDADVAAMVEIIHEKMKEIHVGYSSTPPKYGMARRAEGEAQEVRDKLALEFGRRRGWLLAKRDFTLRALQDCKPHSYSRYGDDYFPNSFRENRPAGYLDHLVFYRWPDKRAAGVVSQTYSREKEKIITWAKEFGLLAEFPDFPSWHNPWGCRLCVLTPMAKDSAP